MATTTAIEWCDHTWNPIVGCIEVSPGCVNCYAAVMAHRLAAMAASDQRAGRDPGRKSYYLGTTKQHASGKVAWTGLLNVVPEALADPLGWRKPRRVFVNSMSDLFHPNVSIKVLAKVLGVAIYCRDHQFQILTKRAGRLEAVLGTLSLERCLTEAGLAPSFQPQWPPQNVLVGVSVEDHERSTRLVVVSQLANRGWRTMVSCEPLLGPVRLNCDEWFSRCGHKPWVIIGGESGPRARPCVIGHVKDLVRQCRAASVPVFVKQLGANPVNHEGERCPRVRHPKGGDPSEWPEDLRVREFPLSGATP